MSVSTIDVPTVDRQAWLDAFSVRHSAWLVSLDVESRVSGAERIFTNEPLIGISVDEAQPPRILITAGRGTECVTHVVDAPTHAWLERTDKGADAAIVIDAADGTRTQLRFRAVALPEYVDDI